MKRATLKALQLDYHIGYEPSPDGLPVFTPEEVEVLRRSRDTINIQLLQAIYSTKKVFGGTLEEVSKRISEEALNAPPPREEIGYVKPVKPDRLATCRAILESLKGAARNQPQEQPGLFDKPGKTEK